MFFNLGNTLCFNVTASFGATCFGENDTTETVFERADEYLYKAKRNGRNLVVTDLSTDL